MNNYLILGLPGLYQNWLLATLDQTSNFELDSENNFLCNQSKISWVKKMETELADPVLSNSTVVNTYVSNQNFVWFLYNFLEKTDGVGIRVDHLVEDLNTKALGTIAFDFMLKHWSDSYDIENHPDNQYRTNSAIEYFYFLLLDTQSIFKHQVGLTDPGFVNIEYADFENKKLLETKLSHLEIFDQDHFDRMYNLLYQRNIRYLDKRQSFVSKIQSNNKNFDILEIAYIGMLLTDQDRLDWFNTQLRENMINDRWSDICNHANNLL